MGTKQKLNLLSHGLGITVTITGFQWLHQQITSKKNLKATLLLHV
jgi:hypothetical protein